MKKILVGVFITGYFLTHLQAQQKCSAGNYLLHQMQADPSLQNAIIQLEEFTSQRSLNASRGNVRTTTTSQVIKIPVVFHVLYHQPGENISDQQIQQQIEALNRDFRKRNADTSKTPEVFVPVAADMEIEFQLAKSGPAGKNTNGIVRKYTPVKSWMSDDKVKFNNEYGDDAWDSKSYLNIWVCNLQGDLGYSTFPGGDSGKEGIVLSYQVVGYGGAHAQYGMGRTCVHEVGHWLNLKHLWGDTYCGDDNVDDTPKQSSYTSGCPTGIRTTCDNAPDGDMYMNYMDFTNDACMNIFTQGQKQRARVLFESGGPRYSILFSKALN
ncbi:MAG: zinc metalloprotease, partial [Chitinophagaceae bacterium]